MDFWTGLTQAAGSLFPAYWTAATYWATTGLVACMFLGIGLLWWDRRRQHADLLKASGFVPQRRGRALKRQREKYVNGLLANDFIEMIQYRLYHREITPDEAQRMYKRLGSVLSYRGLYPSTDDLKALIRLRLGNEYKEKPKLPGDSTPAPAVVKTPEAPKNVVPMFSFSKKVA
jgi:hypothetical protein